MLRAAVIGCGRIGCGFDDDPKRTYAATHAGAYNASADVELAALSDLSREALVKYGEKFRLAEGSLYTDYDEMLRTEKPDIVSICTWSSTHLEVTRKAVEHGARAIFCEKPIAESIDEARTMVNLCREAGVLLFIDHQRRFDPFHAEVRGFIQSGKLGPIRQAHVYYTAGIANTGSHVFDLLRFMLGDAEYVQARQSASAAPNPSDPNLDGLIRFKNGTLCALQAGEVSDYLVLEFDFMGSLGRLKITRSGFDLEYSEPGESTLFSGYRELYPARSPIGTSAPKRFMENAVDHIVQCIEGRATPVSSGEDGLAALELICAFHLSASRDGGVVTLPVSDTSLNIQSR